MSTNYTENFDLCQWEPTDPVIRTDFNADNEKIDAALTALEEAKTRLDRVAVNMAYYTGWLTAKDSLATESFPPQRSMICEVFLSADMIELTGGAVIQNHKLTLSGTGKNGTMTVRNLALKNHDWTRARMWLHYSGGTVTPSLNGKIMEQISAYHDTSISGNSCSCVEYECAGTGSSSANITLTLSTGSASATTVYDYFVVFF